VYRTRRGGPGLAGRRSGNDMEGKAEGGVAVIANAIIKTSNRHLQALLMSPRRSEPKGLTGGTTLDGSSQKTGRFTRCRWTTSPSYTFSPNHARDTVFSKHR
jgi:hypothetical protein